VRALAEDKPDLDPGAVEEEVDVAMVTDLQEKQTAEGRGINKLLKNSVNIFSRN